MSKKFVSNYGDDSIGKYFKEVRKSELLTPEREVELAEAIQAGDEDAIEVLVNANLKFVISIAKEYQNQGLPLADLISEGNYGLIKSAMRFDATRGFRFISYAVWWIKQAIIQSLTVDSRMIRLPANIVSKLSKIKKEIEKFEFENERAPIVGEIVNQGDLDKCKLNTKKDKKEVEPHTVVQYASTSSLNAPINEDGTELSELIGDPDNFIEENYVIDVKLKAELDKTLAILDDRERDIIESYFGINREHTGMTLEDIGEKYDLTKERIRQIKEKAIRKLRHNAHNLFDIINE